MKYKMIAMDMDGTLLNSNKEISKANQTAIMKAYERGIIPVICTGRIFTSARYFSRLIGVNAPIVASNGAYIREKDAGRAVFEKYLSYDYLKDITALIKDRNLYPHLYTSDTIYSEKLIDSSATYTKWNELLPIEDKVKIFVVNNLLDIIQEKTGELLKIVVMSKNVETLNELRKEIAENFNVSIVSSLYNNFEIMASEVSKGNAVKTLADFYNIKHEEIISFGDNENDLSMIQYAGTGVAMGNATEELKKYANYITDSNDNDGVAKAIEKFVLQEY